MKKLENQIKQLATFLPDFERVNSDVSAASVGWHIEHSLLVVKQITATVAQSDPKVYQYKFNFTRFWVYLFNYIPRGKAKAPKVVIPGEGLNLKALEESVVHAIQAVAYLKGCQKNQHFMHPFFGVLNQQQTIRFLAIHTRHHMKIIKDIMKQ